MIESGFSRDSFFISTGRWKLCVNSLRRRISIMSVSFSFYSIVTFLFSFVRYRINKLSAPLNQSPYHRLLRGQWGGAMALLMIIEVFFG